MSLVMNSSIFTGIFDLIRSYFGSRPRRRKTRAGGMVWATGFTPDQCALLRRARAVFLTSSVLGFPLYYLPPVNGWCGGDGPAAKFAAG